MNKGLIHIYTGEGKGKTTAAAGLAIRAISSGLRTLFVQFFKKHTRRGEIAILSKIGVQTMIFDKVRSPLFYPKIDKKVLIDEVKKALGELEKIFLEDNFDLIILDEFVCLIRESLLSEDEALTVLKKKPKRLEIVLTGRGASEKLMEYADYVTYMNKIKHPYKNNVKGRKGIEF
jgi:cob(I)alamin adenosyltransferase